MRRIVPWVAGAAVMLGSLGTGAAEASCPLCFVTAGVGLLRAKYFGSSLEVVGALTGGLSAVAALWMHYALRRYRFPYRPVVFTALMVFFNNMLMIPGNGVTWQRLLFLLIFSPLAAWAWFGALVLFVAILLSKAQKRAFGKTLFPFQTVAVSAVAMVLVCVVPALVGYWRGV